jgi:uncharacterized protein (TIGR00369 family)
VATRHARAAARGARRLPAGEALARLVGSIDGITAAAAIWLQPISVERLTELHVGTTGAHLGIEFLAVGDDWIQARVPVDARTRQPAGILHGGVSVLLAETLGSCGAAFSVPEGQRAVGLDINANHLRSVSDGWVTGTARPVHRGRTTHVWQIDLVDARGRPTCVSRITMAILAAPA